MRSRGPQGSFGDLLPLPAPSVRDWSKFLEGTSRRDTKRLGRDRTVASSVDESVFSLNSLGGFPNRSSWPDAPQNLAQEGALRNLRQLHGQLVPDHTDKSDEAALSWSIIDLIFWVKTKLGWCRPNFLS